jgi:hypothetical protein
MPGATSGLDLAELWREGLDRGGLEVHVLHAIQYRFRVRRRLEELAQSWAAPSRYRPPRLHRQHWVDRTREHGAAPRHQQGSARTFIPQH